MRPLPNDELTPDVPFHEQNPRFIGLRFMQKCISEQLDIARAVSSHLNRAVGVYMFGRAPENLIFKIIRIKGESFRYAEDDSLSFKGIYVLSKTSEHSSWSDDERIAIRRVYLSFDDTYLSEDSCKISLDVDKSVADGGSSDTIYDPSNDGRVKHNSGPSETPIEPVAQVGVMDNPGTSTIPHLPNPQPTAVTPAVAAQDPSLVSALEPLLPHDLLNPLGPPNMLGVGGITFDIKDLIYSQYLDCDVQYQYTDDTPQGQVIFQIPYDPTSNYVNPYIRQWLALHPRYTGALNFRFTVVGNSTFSGLIGFAWYPYTIQSTTVKISEMMKYSYTTMGINEPSNRIFTLFDARQTQFWRDTGDDPKLNPRPVLVCFVYMTAVSPLKEGITIRIRVASKLSDGSDGPPFVASHPVLVASTPGIGAPAPTGVDLNYVQILTGMPIVPVIARPINISNPLYLAIDGLTYKPYMNVFRTGDRIIDMLSGWNIIPNNNRSSLCAGAFQSDNKTPVANYYGLYILDISQAYELTRLGNASSSVPAYNPLLLTFYQTFLKPEVIDPNNPTSKGLEQVADMLSQYCTVYQYATYLSPPTNKASFTYFPAGKAPGKVYSYNRFFTLMFYTSYGPVSVTYIGATNSWVPSDVGSDPTTDSFLLRSVFHEPQYNVTQISSLTPYKSWNPENMPAGWRNVSITGDVPFVTSAGSTTFQNYNHESVQSIFHTLSFDILPTQCLELTVSDLDSGGDLAFIRYYQDRHVPVINLGLDPNNWLTFASLVRPLTRTFISRLAVVERSNTFPITNITNFASNTASSQMVLRQSNPTYDPSNDGPIKPNAAALGGAIGGAAGGLFSGIGQAAGAIGQHFESIAQREWLEKILGIQSGNMFQYQENQNSFLSALSRQNANQQLYNQKDLASFFQEMSGYRTPGALAGVNRAGFQSQPFVSSSGILGSNPISPGGYRVTPQQTSTGNIQKGTQTPPQRPPNPTSSVGTMIGNPTQDMSTQTLRPPGQASARSPTANASTQTGAINKSGGPPIKRRRQGLSAPSGQPLSSLRSGVVHLGGQQGSLRGTSTA